MKLDQRLIPKDQKCDLCQELATYYCAYCMEEYDSSPKFIPQSFYCSQHYETVVITGNCCAGSERIFSPVY